MLKKYIPEEDLIIGKEWGNLLCRNPVKYGPITTLINLLSKLPLPGALEGYSPALSSSYFFCRYIDDVIDGDKPLPKEYSSVEDMFQQVRTLLTGIKNPNNDVEILLSTALIKFQKQGIESIRIQRLFEDFFSAMEKDLARRSNQKILEEQELVVYYLHSFRAVHDLALIGFGSHVTAEKLSDLALLQGKVYSLRDIEEDLGGKICNIPKEVLQHTAYDPFVTETSMLLGTEEIKKWMKSELQECEKLSSRLKQMDLDIQAKAMITFLLAPIDQFLFQKKVEGITEVMMNSCKQIVIALPSSALAVAEAFRLSKKYEKILQITPGESKRYINKVRNLSLCYAGFSSEGSFSQVIKATEAGLLSAAYDVCTDWDKKNSKPIFENICKQIAPRLQNKIMEMYEKDVSNTFSHEGLERGSTSLEIILEHMGLLHLYEKKTDVVELGRMLQVADDILDVEEDAREKKQNVLLETRGNEWLEEYCAYFSDTKIRILFERESPLTMMLRQARGKAQILLLNGRFPI